MRSQALAFKWSVLGRTTAMRASGVSCVRAWYILLVHFPSTNLFGSCRALRLSFWLLVAGTSLQYNTQLFAQFCFGRCRETARFLFSHRFDSIHWVSVCLCTYVCLRVHASNASFCWVKKSFIFKYQLSISIRCVVVQVFAVIFSGFVCE